MQIKTVFFSIGLFILVPAVRTAAQAIPALVQSHLEAFTEAFNSGDSLRILQFVQSSHHPKVLEQVPVNALVNRLIWVYYQYGPLEPGRIQAVNPQRVSLWTRAIKTKAWVGFVFFYTEKAPHFITTIGVDRGLPPPPDEQLPPARNRKDLVEKIDRYLADQKGTPFFSGTVLLARKGKVFYRQNRGFSDQNMKVEIDDQTHFFIASISKMFVAASIMQLEERQLLKTDDVLAKYIPEYPANIGEKVTIHRLLTHTSGIELDEIPEFKQAVTRSIQEKVDLQIRFVPQVEALKNYHLPADFDYTNEGYVLLARIVEVVSGMDYWTYIRQHILQPCGMQHTFPSPQGTFPDHTAIGYTNRSPSDGSFPFARLRERRIIDSSEASPSGGLISTAQDLHRFVDRFFSGKMMNKKSLNTLTFRHISTGENTWYGYGLRIANTFSGLRWGHNGDLLGYSSRLDYYPESGYTVIVLANRDQAAENVAAFISEILPRD